MGFIGSHLMKVLGKKHIILGMDKRAGIDIADFNRLVKITKHLLGKPDLIIHLAAQTSSKKGTESPTENFQDNIMGTFNICRLARILKTKVIYTSSRKALPNKEGNRDHYGTSKLIGEFFLKDFAFLHGMEIIIDRLGNVYGPGQKGSSKAFWLSWFIKASLEKKPITIYGFKGEQSRDMLYIDDFIDLLIDQVENFDKYKGQTYEIGGGLENEVSLIEALKFLEYDNYNFGPALLGDSKRLVYDNKLASSITGWKPKIGWREGIIKMIKKGGDKYGT